MKINKLKERLRKDHPTTAVTINLPEDVVGDLKRVAVHLGFTDFEADLRTLEELRG